MIFVFVLALAGVLAPAAQAHEGTITITCSQVTFHYTKFSPGTRTATEKVSVEGGATQTKSFTFSGAEATDTVAFTPALTGSPTVTAHAEWEGGGTGFEVTKTEKLSCSSPPPPTCPNNSIVSNFNGTKIPGGDFIWFNSVLKAKGVPASGGTITFTGQTVKIGSITVSSPPPRDATITFSPTATTATTKFNGEALRWETIVPVGFGDNVFLSGVAFHVPAGGLPGGISPVSWTGNFTTTGGITLSWQWAAAVYGPAFAPGGSLDYEFLKVKPVHSTSLDAYHNGDQAGTPENTTVKKAVTGGARGGGGSNFTGSYSATGHCP